MRWDLNRVTCCKVDGKRIYSDNARGKAPLGREVRTMPPGKKCSFFAAATALRWDKATEAVAITPLPPYG